VAKRRMRVLSGMRPTGPLHLGHYFGALANWIRLQEEYDCFFFVADWHALTTHYAEDTRLVQKNTLEIAKDWLASGLDPAKSTLFVQSELLEHAELNLLLSMVTPVEWLERVPTYRDQIAQLKDKDLSTYGFLGYPLLQAADIVMYDADYVPVGEDQVPHVELAREVVRRVNHLFGLGVRDELLADSEALRRVLDKVGPVPDTAQPPRAQGGVALQSEFDDSFMQAVREESRERVREGEREGIRKYALEVGVQNFLDQMGCDRRFFVWKPVLKEPQPLLTETPRLPGTDGRRMAKSYGNAIWLSETAQTLRAKILRMMTDPQRVRRNDPGRPEVCPVFAYHKLFSPPEVIAWSDHGCRTAEIGCVECKEALIPGVLRFLEPIQARRRELDAQPERVADILREGSARARKVARRTMRRVREAIFGAVPRGKPAERPAVAGQAAGPGEAR
jgi:tryptophanyl-tRNA synthetase